MNTAVFTLEFMTPAMISGALSKGPESRAEIRIPSIRGQLRWWFRALGGDYEEEARFFGSVAGEGGQASAAILRLAQIEDASGDAPKPLPITHAFKSPKTASDIGCGDMNTSGYLAFNIRRREDARAMVPRRTRFKIEMRAPRLDLPEFHRLCQVFRMFATFGSLGARSRRTFGSLRLVAESGDLPSRPATWEEFSGRRIDWRLLSDGPWDNLSDLQNAAGTWLKTHRNNRNVLRRNRRGEVFGHAGQDGPHGEKRRASPVILRPMLDDKGQFILGLILPRPTPQLIKKAIQ